MSLIQPLLKGLAQPLLIPTTGLPADYWDAVAALGEKWSLNGSLIGSNGTPVTFTRGSQKIYQDSQGKWRSYAVDTPAYGVGLSLEKGRALWALLELKLLLAISSVSFIRFLFSLKNL